jgi:hypothetical protein
MKTLFEDVKFVSFSCSLKLSNSLALFYYRFCLVDVFATSTAVFILSIKIAVTLCECKLVVFKLLCDISGT